MLTLAAVSAGYPWVTPIIVLTAALTGAAILDYERTAGLAQTGEPSKALFESLKETRATMMRKPN